MLKANGVKLKTANGAKVKVKVKLPEHGTPSVTLKDRDKDARDAKAILDALDINKGNKQIAHAIDRVLRPMGL